MTKDHRRLRRAVLQQLESLAAAGVEHLSTAAVSSQRRRSRVNGGEQLEEPGRTSSDAESKESARPLQSAQNRLAGTDEAKNQAVPQTRPKAATLTGPNENAAMAMELEGAPMPPKTNPRARTGPTPNFFDENEPPPGGSSSAPTLAVLREEVAGCTLCDELATTRTQTVFGVGNPQARLCFLGEAPGADEDRLGEPFVGRAGQLLDRILVACGLQRDKVYILNVLKCRPPGNRNPTPEEAANCRQYLNRQLELIQPEFICCLGAVAAQNLLDTTASIGSLRGKIHAYRGIKVVCTYHPAYLLRNPAAKKPTWEDMQMLMSEMGIEPTGGGETGGVQE